jgi:hypothetical protein
VALRSRRTLDTLGLGLRIWHWAWWWSRQWSIARSKFERWWYARN